MGDKLMSVAEAATRLNVCTQTVLRKIHSGQLTAMIMEGGHYRIAETELEKILRPVAKGATNDN